MLVTRQAMGDFFFYGEYYCHTCHYISTTAYDCACDLTVITRVHISCGKTLKLVGQSGMAEYSEGG